MATTPTVPSVILNDFKRQIEAIVPAEQEEKSKAWRFVKSANDVDSGELRNFTLRAVPLGDGVIVGCGNDFQFRLEVITSYKHIQPLDAYPLIIEDQRQLWQTLYLRTGPVAGLQAVFWDGPFEFNDEEDGQIWGLHPYRIRYIASASP